MQNLVNRGISTTCDVRFRNLRLKFEGISLEKMKKQKQEDVENMNLLDWFLAIDACFA